MEIYKTSIEDGKLNIEYSSVQRQRSGDVNCGLFAVCNALELVLGGDLSSIQFKESEMRPHLVQCFANGILEHFPRQVFRNSVQKAGCKIVAQWTEKKAVTNPEKNKGTAEIIVLL